MVISVMEKIKTEKGAKGNPTMVHNLEWYYSHCGEVKDRDKVQ